MKRVTFDDFGVEELESRIKELEDCHADVEKKNEKLAAANEELAEEIIRLGDESSELKGTLIDIHGITDVLIEKLEPSFFSEWQDLFLWNESFDDADLVE